MYGTLYYNNNKFYHSILLLIKISIKLFTFSNDLSKNFDYVDWLNEELDKKYNKVKRS